MTKYYSITQQDIQRLRNVCDRLYIDKEKLDGKLISWESFTSNWLWFDLPENELDRENWKKLRSHWKNSINSEFIKLKRPCELFIVRGRGVQLLANKMASHRYSSDRMKSYVGNVKNTMVGCSERALSNPDEKKLFKRLESAFNGFLYQALGVIDDARLPAAQKQEWKLMIKKSIPKNEVE